MSWRVFSGQYSSVFKNIFDLKPMHSDQKMTSHWMSFHTSYRLIVSSPLLIWDTFLSGILYVYSSYDSVWHKSDHCSSLRESLFNTVLFICCCVVKCVTCGSSSIKCSDLLGYFPSPSWVCVSVDQPYTPTNSCYYIARWNKCIHSFLIRHHQQFISYGLISFHTICVLSLIMANTMTITKVFLAKVQCDHQISNALLFYS